MLRQWLSTMGILIASAVLSLVGPETAQAQVRYGVGVRGGTTTGFYYGSYPFGYSPGYAGLAPGYYYRSYPAYTRYVPYSYGYAYPYGASYSSYYASDPYLRYDAARSSSLDGARFVPYPFPANPQAVQAASPAPAPVPEPAPSLTQRVEIRVAADAAVWFNGRQTSQTGPIRQFITPTLSPGKSDSYDIEARWTQNGREMSQKRTLTFQPGESSPLVVDFTVPDRNPAGISQGGARP